MTTEAPARRTTIHLVPHTHWDREWYRPFQSFRMQLVDLVDRVLDMLDAEPGFAFTLDGQLATVDDYLEIRPEQEERLRAHVRNARLAVGPWQILMDEFLVSGETLVRNLETGWERADAFGGPMRVGYLPDMFGHVAQMPQILRRAGLADAVVWRGIPSVVDRHAFRWEALDGSWVRAEYLPSGYGNAAHLFAVPDRIEAAADRFLEWSAPWFGDDPVLAMYGTDHTAPVPELAGLVSRLNEVHSSSNMRVSTLAQYVEAAPPLSPDAPRWRGEMRSGARANVLMGVASARIDIKQGAGRAETLLERYAEPLTALHVAADAWPAPFLRLAWRKVIENSAHDSICGCSVDPVVDQVLVRFAEAQQIAASLTRRAAAAVAVDVPRGALAILNPSPAPRVGVVEATVAVPESWAEVALEMADGSRVATQTLERKEPMLLDAELRGDAVDELFRRFHGREVFDHAWNGYRIDGRTLTLEVDTDAEPVWLDVDGLRAEVTAAMRAAPQDVWRIRIVARDRRTLAAAVAAPALGWTAARAVEGAGDVASPVVRTDDGRGLDNGLVAVSVAGDGTFGLRAADGTTSDGIGRIVDGGDYGDSYNYGPPRSDAVVSEPASVEVTAGLPGPVRGTVVILRQYDWPSGLATNGTSRDAATRRTHVTTELELRAGEPFVRVRVAFDNQSDDHRVRFHVPLPRTAERSSAEGQFAVVSRPTTGEGGYNEEPLGTYPAHGWVDAGGVAMLLRHLTEYELLPAADGSRAELALTLLRSTGLISRNDNPYRQDPAGPEIAIPNAQMRGRWEMGFALYPHAGEWADADVAAVAERYRHDLVVAAGSAPAGAQFPPTQAGADALRLEGRNVAMSSLRRRPDGWLEARFINLADAPVEAKVMGDITDARRASLRGEPDEPIPVADGVVSLSLGPAEIATVQLRRHEEALRRADVLDAAGPRQGF
jgi:mannosylglycerate hydrolase